LLPFGIGIDAKFLRDLFIAKADVLGHSGYQESALKIAENATVFPGFDDNSVKHEEISDFRAEDPPKLPWRCIDHE